MNALGVEESWQDVRRRNKWQHEFTKLLKEANREIRDHPVWKGRFCAVQTFIVYVDSDFDVFFVGLRLHDKKTGYYKDCIFEYSLYPDIDKWNMNMHIFGKFIDDDALAKPDNIDYRKVKADKHDSRPDNYSLNYSSWSKNLY